MVNQNNAKEADQFNESYLLPQSVLNNLMEQDKMKTTGLSCPLKSEPTIRNIVNKASK